MLTNGLGDCASLIISLTSMSSYLVANSLTSIGNLIPQLFLWLTFESKKESFPDSRQVNVGMRLLIDASQVHFQRILSRCKWCCVIIVHLTSFFPSKEFLLVLESFKIARMKASWKMTKIIKEGSIISPLSASLRLGWNCVNLLVFWRGVNDSDAIKICDTWPLVEASHWPLAPYTAPDWPVPRSAVAPLPGMDGSDTMTQGAWHCTSQHVTTCHGARHVINMTGY